MTTFSTVNDLLPFLQSSDPAILCRTSQQPKSDAEIHAHWLRKEVAKLLPMAEVSALFNNALPLAHAIAEFIASDLIVKTEFSQLQVASVILDNDCSTSAKCDIKSKAISSVYDNTSKTNLAIPSGQHIRLHRDDPAKEAIKSLVKDDKIDSADTKYKLALFNNDPIVDGQKRKSKDVEKPLKILDQGTIVNLGCNDVLFKGESGQYTLLKLGNIITDKGESSFDGTINPTKPVISAHVKLYSHEQITAKTQVSTLYELKFGLGQVKFNTTPQPMESCDEGAPNGCIMNSSTGGKFAMLKDSKYIKLAASSDQQYPYTLNVYNKDSDTPTGEGNFAIENMNNQYLMLTNDKNIHVLIGLQQMLDQANISFTGVEPAKLTAEYIDKNASGSKDTLISHYLSDKKFSPLNAGDVPVGAIDTICSSAIIDGCSLSINKIGTVGEAPATRHDDHSLFHSGSSTDYLKFDVTEGVVTLKLYNDKNVKQSEMTVDSNNGFYVEYPKVLLMNNDNAKPNVILDLKNELGSFDATKRVTLIVPTEKAFSDFALFSDEIVMNELEML